ANHGQFNTAWGSYDSGPPMNNFINRTPLLKGDEQRQVGKVYISAFLDATVRNRSEYLPMFHDYRSASRWLPPTIYLSQFEDSNTRIVSDFENTVDLATTSVEGGSQQGENLTVWRQGEVNARGGANPAGGPAPAAHNKAVFLGWVKKEDATP